MKSFQFKLRDPSSVLKPVTLEGEVSEGARYKLGEIGLLNITGSPRATVRASVRPI